MTFLLTLCIIIEIVTFPHGPSLKNQFESWELGDIRAGDILTLSGSVIEGITFFLVFVSSGNFATNDICLLGKPVENSCEGLRISKYEIKSLIVSFTVSIAFQFAISALFAGLFGNLVEREINLQKED